MEDGIGGTCRTHGERKMRTKFSSENLKGRDHSEVLRTDEGKRKVVPVLFFN
jgi:hypothetical protein